MKHKLLLIMLWSWPALAQPADCVARPDGPGYGTVCGDDADLPDEVLRGAPAPHGLLRGDGPRDVLHNRAQGQVTVTPIPNAPPP
jgi:hypothetical protein